MEILILILEFIAIICAFGLLLGGVIFWVGFFAAKFKYKNHYRREMALRDALKKMKENE